MGFETLFLLIVAVLALLIVVGTAVAALLVLRKSGNSAPTPEPILPAETVADATPSVAERLAGQQPTMVPTPVEDIEAYLAEQRAKLTDFELHQLSNTFKGTTNNGQRRGIVLHVNDAEIPLIAFNSQAFNPQTGTISAETKYGKMEVIITQGRAGVQWNGDPVGVLDFTRQRILGPQGQLLGSMERPEGNLNGKPYPIGFFGEKVADLTTKVNAQSTLRWFGSEEDEMLPAFTNLKKDLEDNQTLLLVGALLLEIGFFDVLYG